MKIDFNDECRWLLDVHAALALEGSVHTNALSTRVREYHSHVIPSIVLDFINNKNVSSKF